MGTPRDKEREDNLERDADVEKHLWIANSRPCARARTHAKTQSHELREGQGRADGATYMATDKLTARHTD